jgi:hypothetical protein
VLEEQVSRSTCSGRKFCDGSLRPAVLDPDGGPSTGSWIVAWQRSTLICAQALCAMECWTGYGGGCEAEAGQCQSMRQSDRLERRPTGIWRANPPSTATSLKRQWSLVRCPDPASRPGRARRKSRREPTQDASHHTDRAAPASALTRGGSAWAVAVSQLSMMTRIQHSRTRRWRAAPPRRAIRPRAVLQKSRRPPSRQRPRRREYDQPTSARRDSAADGGEVTWLRSHTAERGQPVQGRRSAVRSSAGGAVPARRTPRRRHRRQP